MRDSNRPLDVLVAAVGLLLTAPLLLVLALAVRLDSAGPVLLTQERMGRGRRRFQMHKLRTLVTGSEQAHRRAPANDPRITRVGRWLRRGRLDELPQLFDVLCGRMALVGPRPELPEALEAVPTADLDALLSVRPGWTGPTQLAFVAEDEVLNQVADPTAAYRDLLVPAKVRHDLAWLERRTLAHDLGVLIRTPFVLVSPSAWARSRQRVEQLLSA